MRIGFIGTGTMGTPIAACLIRSGHALSVHDREPGATTELRAQGAVPSDSGFAAARDREVVFTSLPGPGEFEAAMLEPQTGVIAGLRPGAAHIDLTTNAPKTISRVAEACRARGVELIDAPVSGRPPAMTVMVGASAAFVKYRPLFDASATNVFQVGPSGAGPPAAPGALASDLYKRAQAAGWGQEGFPVVARVLEVMAGAELRPGRRPE